MSLLTNLIALQNGERILCIKRRNFSVLFFPSLLALAVLWLLSLSLFSLFQLGKVGSVIFFFLLFLALLYILRVSKVWYYNGIIVTNIRLVIIEQYHLLQRHKREITLHRIEKIFIRPPKFFERIFFERTFEFSLHGTQKNFCLRRIRNFLKFKTFLETLVEGKKTESQGEVSGIQFPLQGGEALIETLSEVEAEEVMRECLELLFLLRIRMGEEKFLQILSREKL